MARLARASSLVTEVLVPLFAVDGATIEIVAADTAGFRLRLGASLAGCPGRGFACAYVIEPLLVPVLGSEIPLVVE